MSRVYDPSLTFTAWEASQTGCKSRKQFGQVSQLPVVHVVKVFLEVDSSESLPEI